MIKRHEDGLALGLNGQTNGRFSSQNCDGDDERRKTLGNDAEALLILSSIIQ